MVTVNHFLAKEVVAFIKSFQQ